jgi:hypothetical protein
MWHSSAGTACQRPLITTFETGVSGIEAEASNIVDQLVFCFNGKGSTALSHKALYRESEACLA